VHCLPVFGIRPCLVMDEIEKKFFQSRSSHKIEGIEESSICCDANNRLIYDSIRLTAKKNCACQNACQWKYYRFSDPFYQIFWRIACFEVNNKVFSLNQQAKNVEHASNRQKIHPSLLRRH
jgi:hypothetical protein